MDNCSFAGIVHFKLIPILSGGFFAGARGSGGARTVGLAVLDILVFFEVRFVSCIAG